MRGQGMRECRRCWVPTLVSEMTAAKSIPNAGKRGGYCPDCVAVLKKLHVIRGH